MAPILVWIHSYHKEKWKNALLSLNTYINRQKVYNKNKKSQIPSIRFNLIIIIILYTDVKGIEISLVRIEKALNKQISNFIIIGHISQNVTTKTLSKHFEYDTKSH